MVVYLGERVMPEAAEYLMVGVQATLKLRNAISILKMLYKGLHLIERANFSRRDKKINNIME